MMNIEEFFGAIRKGDLKSVRKWVKDEPKWTKAQDSRGSTPLILAAYYNHDDIVEFLLEKGAKADEIDSSGNTALMGTCFKGYDKIAKLLIEQGANVNQINSMGASCLIYAATFNQLHVAKLLLQNGADPSIKDARGQTALDHAKIQGAQPLIELLENHQNP